MVANEETWLVRWIDRHEQLYTGIVWSVTIIVGVAALVLYGIHETKAEVASKRVQNEVYARCMQEATDFAVNRPAEAALFDPAETCYQVAMQASRSSK